MRTPLDLRSALAKYEWAQHHVKALQADIRRWANRQGDPPVAIRREFIPEKHRVVFWVESVRPIRHSWSLMVGDAFNNYRAALDHLAWQLVKQGRTPSPRRPERIQFPVCSKDKAAFVKMCQADRLPGVSLRVINKLSPLQPYKRAVYNPRLATRETLQTLAELTRTDKHRELLLTVLRPYGYNISGPPDVRLTASLPPGGGKPFQPNTEVVWVRVTPWLEPEPDVRVNFDVARQIAFEGGDWLGVTIRDIDQIVGHILGIFVGH